MNIIEKFIKFSDWQMTTPTIYGWFHIMWLIIMIASFVIVSLIAKKLSDKQNKALILTTALVLIVFEIIKQLNFSYNWQTDTWDYSWYAFPFQFCSAPMYILLIAGIIRKGKIQNAMYSFLATYGLLGGLMVMFYPSGVFISTTIISIQTMVWHSSMAIIGFYLLVSGRVKFTYRSFLSAVLVFINLIIIALLMNILFHFYGNGETFNMFYISPWHMNHFPVFSVIQAKAPYIVFLLSYILGFTLGAYLVFFIARIFSKNVRQLKIS